MMPATLLDKAGTRTGFPDRQVNSVCPYCGVGCQLTFNVKDEKLLFVQGADGPANHQRLCVKGRFGFDYIHHPHRLTRPLVRKDGVGKRCDEQVDPANWSGDWYTLGRPWLVITWSHLWVPGVSGRLEPMAPYCPAVMATAPLNSPAFGCSLAEFWTAMLP